ncbi:MAG: NAD(P)H-dependent oxidoreductase [Parvibaculaceae bacterium]|nr:NAD(P)H-dependent oxidoreductase [Parvibaculaceae bacterium]
MTPAPTGKPKVLVIMGSVRAGRHCPALAAWVAGIGQAETGLDFELVDLAAWPLPMDDEPNIPATGLYMQPHTRKWSEKIAEADAFVFVSPQYNWGYPAVLKNAIDHCHREWHGKPLLIVTYGGHGGDKCAAQLRQVAEGLDMRLVPTMPALPLARGMILGAAITPDTDFREQIPQVRQGCRELAAMAPAP